MTRPFLLCCLAGLLLLPACTSVDATAQVGLVGLAVAGDVSLVSGSGGLSTTASQDIDSAFGLGDEQQSPYVRAEFHFGGSSLAASGFSFAETGRGVLQADFGGLVSGIAVDSELEFLHGKLSYTFDVALGPCTLAPGLAVDVFDLHFTARNGGTSEQIDELVAVPMLFLRGEAGVGFGTLAAEVGYTDLPRIQDTEGTILDLEAMLEVQLSSTLHAFVGYRLIDVDATGDTDTESFGVDLQVRGWTIGGGYRF